MLKPIILTLIISTTTSRLNYCPWGNYPVCGIDKTTYENPCDLMTSYTELLHTGQCSKHIQNGYTHPTCPQKYIPICGRDGVTYINKCRLDNNNIKEAYKGACGQKNYLFNSENTINNIYLECDCIGSPFKPICSLNGINYENECLLNCTQQISYSLEPCGSICDCERKYMPVCGVDGYTYDNKCSMKCVNVVLQGRGECPSLLRGCEFCSRVFMPACGVNGVTYRNLCEMRCNNVRFEHFGKCKDIVIEKYSCDYCSNVLSPICGTDGRNYRNECLCTCRGNCRKYSNGKCPKHPGFDCKECKGVKKKVCGNDGKVYDNACYCRCNGKKVVPCVGSSV